MTVLSFDQSSTVTGYALFVDGKLDLYGKFSFDDKDVGIRLNKIRYQVFTLIQLHRPDHVVFEDIQFQDNVANSVVTFKVLAEVYGVISQLLTELEIPHSTVLAGTWKKTLGIGGRTRPEQKKNAQKHVKDIYNVDVIQDIADAICIGEHYIKMSKSAWD